MNTTNEARRPAVAGLVERTVRRLLAWWRAAGPDMATPSGGYEAEPEEERIEAAYWRFDARHNGYGKWKAAPMSERDAFKAEMRNALAAEKTRAQMRLVAHGWRRPGA